MPVWVRLGVTTGSALLLCWLFDLGVHRTGVELVDGWLRVVPYAAMLFAVLAISGLPHAFNIIDGYNGLAGTVAVQVCLAITHVALQLGDRALAAMVVCLVGATLGFLMWNYPRGDFYDITVKHKTTGEKISFDDYKSLRNFRSRNIR